MKLIWTQHAENMRESVIDFIADDNIDAAIEMDILISQATEKLLDFPKLGRKGRIRSTYELVIHAHYILVYQIKQETIIILALAHTSREFSTLLQ